MANLHGKPICIGDRVYDCIDGWGCVESVTCSCIWVKIGKRSRKRYDFKGFTGRRGRATLFFHPVPNIVLSKDPDLARHQRELLEHTITLLNKMCPEDKVRMCQDTCPSVTCGCGQTHCNQCQTHYEEDTY